MRLSVRALIFAAKQHGVSRALDLRLLSVCVVLAGQRHLRPVRVIIAFRRSSRNVRMHRSQAISLTVLPAREKFWTASFFIPLSLCGGRMRFALIQPSAPEVRAPTRPLTLLLNIVALLFASSCIRTHSLVCEGRPRPPSTDGWVPGRAAKPPLSRWQSITCPSRIPVAVGLGSWSAAAGRDDREACTQESSQSTFAPAHAHTFAHERTHVRACVQPKGVTRCHCACHRSFFGSNQPGRVLSGAYPSKIGGPMSANNLDSGVRQAPRLCTCNSLGPPRDKLTGSIRTHLHCVGHHAAGEKREEPRNLREYSGKGTKRDKRSHSLYPHRRHRRLRAMASNHCRALALCLLRRTNFSLPSSEKWSGNATRGRPLVLEGHEVPTVFIKLG